MSKLLPVLFVLFCLLIGPGMAEDYELDLKKIKLNRKNTGIFPEIELRPGMPAELSREPKYRSARPQKFVTAFGRDEAIAVAFAVDEKAGDGEGYDYLYIDSAGKGDLARGKKLNGKIVVRSRTYLDTNFPTFNIEVPDEAGAFSVPMHARLSWSRDAENESSLYLTTLCYLTGKVSFEGEERKIFVFDADCNGIFGDTGSPDGTVSRGDRVWIGKGSMKPEGACVEALPIGRYFYCEGDYFEMKFSGRSVSVTKADVPLGTVTVNHPGFLLELVQNGNVLYVNGGMGDSIKVPAGRYRINKVSFRKKHRGKIWELAGEPGAFGQGLTVEEDGETSLTLGAPVKIMVSSTMRTVGTGIVASLSFFIEGSGGEKYKYLLCGGKKIDLPDISVRNGSNREVHEGQFEYG